MSGARNLRGGLALLAAGLLAGLAMSLYAFEPIVAPPASLADYDALPRRLLRLAHVAAVMLPLLNIVLAPLVDRVRLGPRGRAAASWMLLAGAATLPAALALQAVWPLARVAHLAAPPALAFVTGVVLLAAGARRATARELVGGDRAAICARDHRRPRLLPARARQLLAAPRQVA